MRQEDKLKEKYGSDPRLKVPEGYFEELNVRILNNLPAYPEAPKSVDLSLWQRVKPYVYLAAMFAGIWLMMNMFHRLSSSADSLMLDNPPEAIVQMLDGGDYDMIPVYESVSDYDLEQEVSGIYDSFEDFETDFGYDLSPEYSSIKISPISGKNTQAV